MSEYITRADFWQETTDTEGVVPAGCPTRVEAQDGTAWEDVSKHDRLIGGWLRTQRVFIDTRWKPPVPPLKVGDTVTTVEQLEVLPIGAVVLDKHRNVWQGQYNRAYAPNPLWHSVGVQFGEGSAILFTRYSPLTVIWLPETEDDQ